MKLIIKSCETIKEKLFLIYISIMYIMDIVFPIYFILNNIAVIFSIIMLFLMGLIMGFIVAIDVFDIFDLED